MRVYLPPCELPIAPIANPERRCVWINIYQPFSASILEKDCNPSDESINRNKVHTSCTQKDQEHIHRKIIMQKIVYTQEKNKHTSKVPVRCNGSKIF
jgi:hypothetical protein